MGTPGMAFIRSNGHTTRIRSRYDGHIDSFGYGCASAIAWMPPETFNQAAAAFELIEDGSAPKRSVISKTAALSTYAQMVSQHLSERTRDALMGLAPHPLDLGVPYSGLGPVLLRGFAEDASDMGYDYAYAVDIDNERFGLLENDPEDSGDFELKWSASFDQLRAIPDEEALVEAFDALSNIEYDATAEEARAQADAIFAKASARSKAKPTKAAEFDAEAEAQASKDIMSRSIPAITDAGADHDSGRSGNNYNFPDPIHAIHAHGAFQLAAQTDPVARQLHFDSGFGFAEDGAAGGQLLTISRSDPGADAWLHALSASFASALASTGQEAGMFSSSGSFGGMLDDDEPPAPALKDWSDATMEGAEVERQLREAGQAAERWNPFDISLILQMRREDWLAQIKASLADPKLDPARAISYSAYGLGCADAEVLQAIVDSGHAQSVLSANPAMLSRLASHAGTGLRLLSALNPKLALQSAQALMAGPFSALAAHAQGSDTLWLSYPACCIAKRQARLLQAMA